MPLKFTMKDYKDTVRSNKKHFDWVESEIPRLVKKINGASKEYCQGKVINAKTLYGLFSLKSEIIKMLKESKTSSVQEATLMYLYFDKSLNAKVDKFYLEKMVDSLLLMFDMQNEKFGQLGFWISQKAGGKSYVDEDNTLFEYTKHPRKVISDYINRSYLLEAAMTYMLDNADVFPKSLLKEVRKRVDQRDNDEIMKINNSLEYRVYKNSLPSIFPGMNKLNADLQRYMVREVTAENILKARMYILRAFIEKYGYNEMLKKDRFLNVVNSVMNNSRGGEGLSLEEKKSLMTKEMYRAIVDSRMNSIGFYGFEEELHKIIKKEMNENFIGAERG